MPAPIIYIPHGGGPLPLLDDPSQRPLTHFLKAIGKTLGQPKAILVISAHWETNIATVSSAQKPAMIYDYHGFPQESYQITSPAPGQPDLAKQVCDLIKGHGLTSTADAKRGFDHGTFVPLKLMYPAANIPVVQLSLVNSLDAQTHIELGKAIGHLATEDVLIIGSGFSFHNMNAFMSNDPAVAQKSQRFDAWLNHVLLSDKLSTKERETALSNWLEAPEARYSHPREEHLLPLHVCFGAAITANLTASNVFDETIVAAKRSGFLWQ